MLALEQEHSKRIGDYMGEDGLRIAIVTGASSGLGREYAKLLDKEGMDEIWLIARRENLLRGSTVVQPENIFSHGRKST